MKNSAKIERVEKTQDINEPNDLLTSAGNVCKPFGAKLVASVAIHYYEVPGQTDSNVKTFQFVSQRVGLKDVDEGQCDAGLKELKRALMADYGRPEPRTR